MQPTYNQPDSRKIAFQQGLIMGLILAAVALVILLINTFVNTIAANAGTALLLGVLVFFLGLVAYFVAGILASKKTGKVSTGTLAGLWTGGIYGVISFIVSLGLFFSVNLPRLMSNINNLPSSTSPDTFRTLAIVGGVGGAIFGIAFAIGLGAGLGALGGLIGKSTSKVSPPPAYPNQPYPAQPYPPASAYPNQPYPSNPYPNQPYPNQPYEQ